MTSSQEQPILICGPDVPVFVTHAFFMPPPHNGAGGIVLGLSVRPWVIILVNAISQEQNKEP